MQVHFLNQQEQRDQISPNLEHNTLVLEIANSWNFVRWLMYRYREGLLKKQDEGKKYLYSNFDRNLEKEFSKVDQLDQIWLNFIMQNGINIESYKNEDEFVEKNLKELV